MLGDVLATPEEQKKWRLGDWPVEVERQQEGEAYEWIRIDADFEWICKAKVMMPSYMYISQLQQDKDVVAQAEVSLLLMLSPNALADHQVNSIPGHQGRQTYIYISRQDPDGQSILPRHSDYGRRRSGSECKE
jgi:hypothetical protein